MATSGDNKRKSLLQEFVDENGTSGLNQNYVKNALKNGGGFGATASGTYIDDEGYQYIKPFRKSGERGPNVYVGRQYGRNETTTITGPDGVNEWFENARFTLSSLSDYNDKNRDTYDRDYGSSFSTRISELMASAKDVEDYLVEHQGEITNFDDLYSSLAGYQNALMQYDVGNYSRKQYYSQWENEDSYNSYLSQLEELERLRNFDTASAQKELDDLNAVLEQAKQYQAQMDRYVSGAGRDESLYISALTKRNSLLKKYGYSDIDELEKTISQKNVDFHRATRFQSGEQLTNDAINAQDFEEYARMGAELSNPDHNSFAIGSWHPFDGEVQNKVTYSRDNYYNIIRAAKSGAHTDGDIIYHYMTDDEVKIHNYYLAKYGEEKADEYLDSIEEQLNARLASGMFEDLEGKTAQELVFGISAGIDQFGSGMKSLFSGEDYIPVSAMQIASQMVREDLADNGMKLPEAVGGASLGQVAYDAVTTGANMLPSILTSSLVGVLNPAAGAFTGAALLGASASGNAYQEMLNLGYDKWQARAYSALVGASEAGLQYLLGGIGKLGGKVSGNVLAKLVSNVDNAFARTAIKIGGNMLSEGAEEYLQEILTPWFENLTLYTENEIELITPESLYSGLLGALTAGFMDGGSTVKGEINTYNTGKTLQKADISAERLARLGKTFSADSVAYQLAGRVNENTGAYTMGRLFNEIGATLTEQNQAEITKSLERKGVAHDDAVTISETLAAVVEGRTLSERQAAVLNANDVVSKTVMDVIINPNSTVNQRTQNYNEALMSLAREKAGKKATADTAASAEDVTGEPATPAEGKVTSPVDDVSERVLEASADGKTVRKSSGEEVKIARIASTKDGKMTLKLDTGETVNAEDVSYASEGEALVYETVARLNTNVEAANALVDAYDPSMSAEVYARGIEEAYRYGMYNFSVKEMADKSSFASELTQVQRNTAYKLGQIFGGREVAKQQAIIKKARAGTKAAKAEGKVHFDGDRSTLNERQSTSLTALEKIADALGVQIYVFESEEVNGKRKGANGWFDPKDSSIHIDLYAGQSGESTMLFTAAHELTHFIRQWSPAKFKVLANFLMEQYGKKGVSVDILVRQQMEKARNNGRTISYATAYEEVVADSMETMLADGKVAENLALLKEKDQTLWGKIKEFFAEFTAKVQAAYKGMNPDSAEGRYVAEMKYAVEQLQALFTEGLVEASENYQGSFTPGKEGTVFTAEGEPVAQSTADGSVMLSMRTYEESGRDEFRKYLEKCVSSNRLTKTEMQEMLDGIEEIYQVCKKFKNKYAPFGTWSDAAVVRDTYGRPVFSVVTPNGEYKMNLDFSLVCKKRRTLDAVFNEMARRGIIDNFELGQKSVVKINEIIRKHGFETACALCFVDAKRFRQASMADQFVGLYNELVESLVPESKRGSIDRFNFGGNENVAKVEGGIDTWADSALDFSHIDHVLATYAKGTVEYKSAKYIKSSAEARKLLARGDFMSSAGFDAVKSQNKTILSLYNSKKGTGGPKAAFGDVQYMNEIIKKARSWTPAKAYAVGGVRIQSFSDYVPRMVFDYVQMIYDLAATKLPAHAYTKEALFAKQFGLTGVKINMSLIPAIAEGGIAPGLDAKGNYVWAGESFDFDTAKEIQNAEGYSENCGTICVGVSDLHIRKLLADPEIRMVIPYHKSGLNPIVAHMNRIAQFTDYTGSQNTLDRNGTKIAKDFDFDRALHSMGEKGDPKAVIKEYLDWCDSNGYTPKFSQFRDHPNYYKLIEDFTLYDKNGQYVPQREVRAVFPQADSAFGSMKELIEAGLQEDAVIEGKRDKTLSAIVDEIEQTLPKTEAEIPETEVKQADRDIEAIDSGTKFSLREVEPIQPSSDKWKRTLTTAEAKSRFPSLWDVAAEESEVRNPTQISSTVKSYRKIYDFLKAEGFYGTILDASSGLGYGTRAGIEEYGFDVEDIEPYPDKSYNPKYRDYSTLNKKYDVIISNAVLNVLPQDQRDALTVKMGELLNDGGRIFINVRGKDVDTLASTKTNVNISPMEWFVGSTGSYQKGFTKPELVAYLQDALGDGFTVKPTNLFGAVSAVVTKDGGIKLSDRDYSYNALVSKPDMKVTTISGNVPKNRADVVYYAKKNAASFSKVSENGNPLVYVDDIDTEVMLSTKGLRHGLDRRFDVNAPVTLKAGEIIKNAIRINELTPDKDTVDASYVLIGAAKNEKNEPYIVQFVVNRATNEVTSVDVLYSVNAKTNAAEAIKKESTGSLSPEITDKSATLTDSNISIAELLDYVNKYFPDILPEEVLKHYGHDARPEGKLGESALFSDRSAEMEKVNQVLEKENGKLREDVSYLKEMLKLQKTVTGGTKFTKSSVESAASYLMKYANARGDKAELAKRLTSFYEYIAKGEELTWESVKEEAAPAAEWLMDNLIQGMKVEYIYEEDLLEQDLIGQVYDSYWRVSTLRTVADVKQKEINRLKAHHANRMQELKDAHTESVNKLKQEYKASIEKLRKDYRNSVEHKQQEIKAAYQESRKKAVEGRRRTAMRHKIKDVVNELNTYLLKGTKDKHVMIGLQKAAASALDAVNMDTVGAEERIAKLNEELTRAKTPEKIKEIMGKIERIQAMGDKMSDRLARLKAAYAEIKDSDDPLIANSHDEVIEAKIEAVTAIVGDTALRDMSLSQLEDVYELYKMVLTTIRNANKTFKAEKGKEIAVLGNNVMMEVEEAGGKKKLRIKGLDGVSKFMWNNLKPVYAFKAIGSKTLSKVFDSVRAGEDTWARDVSEAREYYLEKSKKYGYDSWDFEKRYGFKSSSGMDFNLNLEQIMSLYAYSKREHALDHLERGGIVFDETTEVTIKTKLGIPLTFNPMEATAYNISPDTLAKITGKLTKEQKAFVDEMQDYLSTTMGAKGNEVSLEMYGVKLFKEKFYFPLKSATQFMAKAKEQQKGEVKIKNSGFSKETVRKANNPIVLTPFMDVWANHVNEMSMYHAFVLPMEDFYRVFNYKTPTSDTMPTESVEMYIQNAYGKGATAYIEQLLRDLNGGARSDPTAGFINKMMGLFKKGAVFASASVVIQQPSAIARALALVDSKYFVGKKMDSKKHAELWAEVKKYAPVAIIKEMGYFDTNMGKSTADFIKAKEYGSWRDKMTALVKDGGYRDEVLSKAPAVADELAWCQIWEAVKRETMDKTSLRPGSEEFMLKAGERFTEVIVNTQVYDSVLSRSANMRSKDTGMKMATAFLAEPTTSINMIADALIQGKRGNVKYARSAIGAVIASQILNAILVSFVYAGRDDDEDETYWEKYLGSLTAEIKDSFNLFGYIPFVKDVVSIVQGYDVERSDISVISDLWKAWEQLSSDNLSVYRKVENFAGSIAQMFGLPVRNIMRDARGLYQTVESFMNGQHTTGAGIKYAVMGAITNETVSDTQQLYEAMLNDDEAHAERVRGRFKDQSAVDSAIRKALRENDPRIHEAAVARNNGDIAEYTRIAKEIIAEGHFSQDLVVTAINAEINKLDQGKSENSTSDKQVGMYNADDFAAAVIGGDAAMANAVRTDIIRTKVANGDTQAEAEKSFASSASSSLREEFLEGRISEQKAVQALVNYCGKDQEDAEDLVGDWSFRVKYGFEYSQKDEAYMRGELSATELKSILMETEGMDAEKADAQIQVYDWEADGYEHVTIARVQDYNDHCAALGVPKDIYLEIRYIQSNTENDKDENGKSISYSAVQKIMAEINSYNLTPAQKTAIAESIGWSEKTIRKYKLW